MIFTKADCHIHMALDGIDYKVAFARHRESIDKKYVRSVLEKYKEAGIFYLRDGGDKYGVGAFAASIAEEYGITYLSPIFPIYKKGCYGIFIGEGVEYENDIYALIKEVKAKKGSFIKIMASGIVDFDNFGKMFYDEPDAKTIKEMIHVAHEEGFKVMAHASGERGLEASIEYGADSIEHGYFINNDCLIEMCERKVVWVPTVATVAKLEGKSRFNQDSVVKLKLLHMDSIRKAADMGVLIACGSDAGAFGVEHVEGCICEIDLLKEAIGDRADEIIREGNSEIFKGFANIQEEK